MVPGGYRSKTPLEESQGLCRGLAACRAARSCTIADSIKQLLFSSYKGPDMTSDPPRSRILSLAFELWGKLRNVLAFLTSTQPLTW